MRHSVICVFFCPSFELLSEQSRSKGTYGCVFCILSDKNYSCQIHLTPFFECAMITYFFKVSPLCPYCVPIWANLRVLGHPLTSIILTYNCRTKCVSCQRKNPSFVRNRDTMCLPQISLKCSY